MEQILDIYESANPFPDTLTKEEIMRVIAKTYGSPLKPQKPEKLQSSRIDRLESKIDEIGQMTSKFSRRSLNDQSRKPFIAVIADRKGIRKQLPKITHNDISLADAESKFSIKSEEMLALQSKMNEEIQTLQTRAEELERDLSLAQEELLEMESFQSRAEEGVIRNEIS
ncbi:6562_t:CDS:2 [Funneliformis geosporum]|nr:6562_t:CDS:2 [Funneliformis geosporum]